MRESAWRNALRLEGCARPNRCGVTVVGAGAVRLIEYVAGQITIH